MSRELDAEVAERIMGWKRMSWEDYGKSQGHLGQRGRKELTYSWHDDKGVMTENAEDMGSMEGPSPEWSPSTDISAAFQVVEKMRERGWEVVMTDKRPSEKFPNAGLLGIWTVSFGCKDLDESVLVQEDTLPEAICKAALSATTAGKGQQNG